MLESDQTCYGMLCITFHWFMLYLLFLCAVGAHASAKVPWRGQRTMCGENSFSPFILLVVSRDQTWTLELGSKPLYPLIHLSIPLEWCFLSELINGPGCWKPGYLMEYHFWKCWGRDMILWPNRHLTDSPNVGDGIVAASFSQGCVHMSIYHRQSTTNRPKNNSTKSFLVS